MTPAEMALFIESRKRRQRDDYIALANVGYVAGMLGSMSLAKTRPKFSDLFSFDDVATAKEADIEKNKKAMIVWAENLNRASRKKR